MTAPAPSALQAVFLDVDGVLLDSLQDHLQYCAEKAGEYGLSLRMPTAAELRMQVARGLEVSPMERFFLAVGFPAKLAARGARDYRREFALRHRPRAFAGVPDMLARLAAAGLTLGLVTSNTRANVEAGLAAAMAWFDPRCQFFFDSRRGIDKGACLREGAERLGVARASCIYVGDQPADLRAAHEAGCRFLGVTYGWGLVAGGDVATVDTVAAIADVLANGRSPQLHDGPQPRVGADDPS